MSGRAAKLLARRKRSPLSAFKPLPLQLRYMQSQARFRLIRAGNQSLGKTTAALTDLYLSATGEHPYREQERPGEYWVICASWPQSLAIQKKLNDILDESRTKPGTRFDPALGFRGKNPSVSVRHNNGEYSIIRFKTTQQNALDLAGATIDGALFDEVPTSQRIYTEVYKRVQARGGWVSIAMTPINAPIEWIRKEAEEGRIEDIWSPLTVEQLVPVGDSEPRWLPSGEQCTAEWIASITAATPAHEVPVLIHGEWEIRDQDRYFTTFRSTGPNAHVTADAPAHDVRLYLGIDHGHRPGKQIAFLVALWTDQAKDTHIYVLDEYVDDLGTATYADDALGIKSMLERNEFAWSDLDAAHGDRVHMPGKDEQKSNRDLTNQLMKLLNTRDLQPRIRVPHKGRGSVDVGCRWINQAIVRDQFHVNPRCKRLIEALDRYTGGRADEELGWKDPVDALRYALDPYIFARGQKGAVVTVYT